MGPRRRGLAVATVRADAFCHSMVRSLVGCLLAVGRGPAAAGVGRGGPGGRRPRPAVTVVPAHGLTLEEVGYPADAELAAQAARTRRRRDELRSEHYFTADPSVPFRARAVHLRGVGPAASTWSVGPGSTAAAGSTTATAVLFRETEPPAPGRILDLGCGYGVIGLAIAAPSPGRGGHRRRRQRARAPAGPTRTPPPGPRGPLHRAACRTRCPTTRRTTRSGPTRRSGSASRRCTPCC